MKLRTSSAGLKVRLWLAAICAFAALAVLATWLTARPTDAAAAKKSAALTVIKYQIGGSGLASAHLYMGKKLGFFRKEGIDLQITNNVPVPQLVPNLLNGQTQMFSSVWGGHVAQVANGVPTVAIYQDTMGGRTAEKDVLQFVAPASSGIRTIADLKGKTIGTSALGSLQEIGIRYLAIKAGLGTKDIKFALVNTADMPAAVKAGRIDAAAMTEPTLSQLRMEVPLRVFGSANTAFSKDPLGYTISVTSREFLAKNKNLIARFRRADQRSQDWASKHPKQIRAFWGSYTGIQLPKAVNDKIVMPNWDSKVDFRLLSRYISVGYNLGKISKKIDPRTAAVLK